MVGHGERRATWHARRISKTGTETDVDYCQWNVDYAIGNGRQRGINPIITPVSEYKSGYGKGDDRSCTNQIRYSSLLSLFFQMTSPVSLAKSLGAAILAVLGTFLDPILFVLSFKVFPLVWHVSIDTHSHEPPYIDN